MTQSNGWDGFTKWMNGLFMLMVGFDIMDGTFFHSMDETFDEDSNDDHYYDDDDYYYDEDNQYDSNPDDTW